MDKVIQASEANRQFSRILREVAQGDTFTVTSHGRPIGRIVPAETDMREAAKQRLLERLEKQPAMRLGRWMSCTTIEGRPRQQHPRVRRGHR